MLILVQRVSSGILCKWLYIIFSAYKCKISLRVKILVLKEFWFQFVVQGSRVPFIYIKLFALLDTSHFKYAWFFIFIFFTRIHTLSHNVKESEKKFPDPSLYPDPDQKWLESILHRGPSSIQNSWKYFWLFLCNPAVKPTNQQTDTAENTTFVVEIIMTWVVDCR